MEGSRSIPTSGAQGEDVDSSLSLPLWRRGSWWWLRKSLSSPRAGPSASPGCGDGADGAVGSRCQGPQGGDSVLTAPHPPRLPWGGSLGSPCTGGDSSPKAGSRGIGGGRMRAVRTEGSKARGCPWTTSTPLLSGTTKPLHGTPPSARSLHAGSGKDPYSALRGYRGPL